MPEEKKLKCARCGKELPPTAGWQVGLKPIGPGSLVYFDICDDCRVIWQIAMGHWLEAHGKESKEAENGNRKEEIRDTEQVSRKN